MQNIISETNWFSRYFARLSNKFYDMRNRILNFVLTDKLLSANIIFFSSEASQIFQSVYRGADKPAIYKLDVFGKSILRRHSLIFFTEYVIRMSSFFLSRLLSWNVALRVNSKSMHVILILYGIRWCISNYNI